METNIFITTESAVGKGLKDWWVDLAKDTRSRATLRRCATVDEIVLCPAYQRFYRYMLTRGWPEQTSNAQKDKLAAFAGLAAWIKKESEAHLPYQMSESAGDRPVVSELRFRALLKLQTTDEFYRGLRRTLPLIGHEANVIQLAHDVYFWNDTTKKRWAYSYRWPA